jgi:peptide-methionine (R)-S-oxide reductase
MKWLDVLRYAREGSPAPDRRVEKSDDEWKKQLSLDEFYITRQKGTERAFTGEYCEAHEPGLYACKCCDTLLFNSAEKFESGTGWPSFTIPVKENVIKYEKDTSFGMTRVEVMCNVCDCHLGHVFPDGPPPTGLRFCINSASIKLVSSKESHLN